MSRQFLISTLLPALFLAPATAGASDHDVILSEVHYNPLSGLADDEFIELANRGPTSVDLSRWRFTEGIDLVLPAGTLLGPGDRLIVSPNAARARTRYAVPRIVGDYSGRLDNNGEIVTLTNASGDIIGRVHYGDEGAWPTQPDGLGPSLELRDLAAQPDVGESWVASRTIDGTPGAPNSREGEIPPGSRVLVAAEGPWRYREGTQEASSPPSAWTRIAYNDSAWPAAPGGFGYGSQPFQTELPSMQGLYSSLYLRAEFTLTADEIVRLQAGTTRLAMTVRYDDGAVIYLNGEEVRRENAGNAGTPPPFDALADGSLTSQAVLDLGSFTGDLIAGANVLAIHALNSTLASGDFFIEAELGLHTVAGGPSEAAATVLLNEVKATEAGSPGFIELFNPGAAVFPLDAHAIVDANGNRHRIAAATSVPGRGRVVLTDAQLGFTLSLAGQAYALVDESEIPGSAVLVDALSPRAGPAGAARLSFGRVPDGDDDLFLMQAPSPNAANAVTPPANVVIHEINYHPPYTAPGGGCAIHCSAFRQWIEIHNRGAADVNVAGWSLSSGVELMIPASPAVNLPAGGYLVLASHRDTFLAGHPGFDPARVLGDWTRDLAHGSDTINLNDELGNRVDRVTYGDGTPTNDNEPQDGEDDLTFLGSAWTRGADGSGRTLELMHPRLDNRDGHAWAAGPIGGTPGAANAAFVSVPPPVIGDVGHSPAVPRPSEPVRVKCRVSATQPITSVEALWHREGGGPSGTAALRDDGLSGDGAAGDGVFAGSIAAQPDGAIVGFQVRARLQDGKQALVPRSPQNPPHDNFAGPFYLYQTLAAPVLASSSQNYFVVMSLEDQDELESRPAQSNVLLPCTFIRLGPDGASTVRHLAGIRYRGEQTRNDERKGYRINFPSEHEVDDIEHLNLVAAGVDSELVVSDLFRRAGLPYPREWPVSLTFQGTVDPRYAAKEHLDGRFLTRFFGGAGDDGSFYRAVEPNGLPGSGDLTYHGEDPADYVVNYEKRTNQEENDYSDLIELCRTFDATATPDAVFPDAIEQLIAVDQWARYFALQACVSNSDGSIHNTSGEDYYLYHVPAASNRPDAGRWVLVPWDIEESFANPREQILRPQLPAIRRFLTHPRFAPYYYANLVNLRWGVFSRQQVRQRLDLIAALFGAAAADAIDGFVAERVGFLDGAVPRELSAGAVATVSGGQLIGVGDVWRYFKGTQSPPGGGVAWTQRAFNDGAWLSGATGIGYGDGDDATLLDDMLDEYSTFYARRAFTVEDPAGVRGLALIIDYDDGFVAYLNGIEVARRNAPGPPGSVVAFDDTADDTRESGNPETIDITAFRDRLAAGNNVLAVQVLNNSLDSTDVSFRPALVSDLGPSGGLGCGSLVYSTADSLELSGRANAHRTGSVTVNGVLASYNTFTAAWTFGLVGLAAGDNTVIVRAFEGPGGVGNLVETSTITVRRLTRAPTTVAGTLNGVTQWTEAAGPYLLGGDVIIPAGSRLEVQPGTVVLGAAGASIVVRGEIHAAGTDSRPILFRAQSCGARWGGIVVENTGVDAASPTHTLSHCDIELASPPDDQVACVAAVNARLLVERCSFRNLAAGAIEGDAARVEVRDSVFEQVGGGVRATNSTAVVLGSTFHRVVGNSDGVRLGSGRPAERSRVEDNLFDGIGDDGIELQGAAVDVAGNIIRNAADRAISLSLPSPQGPPTVSANQAYRCGTGLALTSGARVIECRHNTITGNQTGLLLAAAAGEGAQGAFQSSIVWSNTVNVAVDALSTAAFEFSDVAPEVLPGAGNIAGDPRFTDAPADDYSLRPGSPCIGTGKDGTDMGAVPFTGAAPAFVRGDSDRSGVVNVGDVILSLAYLFRGGAAPACLDAADANDDGGIDITDPVYALFYLFAGGSPPPAPHPLPGVDATADGLSCF